MQTRKQDNVRSPDRREVLSTFAENPLIGRIVVGGGGFLPVHKPKPRVAYVRTCTTVGTTREGIFRGAPRPKMLFSGRLTNRLLDPPSPATLVWGTQLRNTRP